MATAESVLRSILKLRRRVSKSQYRLFEQRDNVVDPRDLLNQVRADLESNRWTAFVLVGILILGLAAWGHVLSTRATAERASPDRSQISVLTDPFVDQQ